MSLDLGALRIAVEVDKSQVAPGLSQVRQTVAAETQKIAAETEKAGRRAGEKLAEGMTRGADGRLRGPGGRLVSERVLSDESGRLNRWAGRIGYGIGSSIRSGVGTAGNILSRGASDVAGFAARGVAALGTLAVAGAAYGASVASSNEQAILSFTTMLRKGDDTAAEAHGRAVGFVRDLQRFAAQTPFEFSDLQKYSGQLVAAGIDANKIIPIMRTLGDVTTGVGTGSEGINRATVALQQMIAAQKISAEDLNQLRDAGIPVYDLLAGATGKSKKEIVELAQTGKLGKRELDALLDTLASKTPKGLERFSGLMAKQSTTLKGQLSNLADTASQGLGRIVSRGMSTIKSGVRGVSDTLSGVFRYLDAHGDDLSRIFRSAGRVASGFARAVGPALKAFTGGLSGGQDSLTALADWMDTHEADLIGFFTGAGHAAIGFGKVSAVVVSGALHAYAGLSRGIGAVLDFILSSTKSVIDAIEAAYSSSPFLKNSSFAQGLRSASDALGQLRENNKKNDAGAGAAEAMANGIDNSLLPALNRAGDALDSYGQKQADAARQSGKVRTAINAIGTGADGAQVHLKRFADVSKLSADEQAGFRSRLSAAREALQGQIHAQQTAGAGQKALNKTWAAGRAALYAEFRQMGLSKAEAGRLATKYAGIKPKVETKFTTPGLPKAKRDAADLKYSLDHMPRNIQIKIGQSIATKGDHLLKSSDANVSATGGVWTGSRIVRAAEGTVLPGWTPGVDVHRFWSPTGGRLDLSGGESIMRPEWTALMGGPRGVAAANLAARQIYSNPALRYATEARRATKAKDTSRGPLIGAVTFQASGDTRTDLRELQYTVRSVELGRRGSGA